ncbi:MAG: hypothetical protein WDZ91_02425 [Paenibacillaceae bacterium]
MYRLLIVDDETVIADGLFEVFSKFDIEFDLCKAYSGFEHSENRRIPQSERYGKSSSGAVG